MRTQKGFTLIELLVVTSIISLLASVVLSLLNNARDKGNDAAKIRSLQEIRTALDLYRNDKGNYPVGTTNGDLSAALVSGSTQYIKAVNAGIKYQSLNTDNTTCASNCYSYHLGIALTRTDNAVLSIDKDLDAGFNGKNDACGSTGGSAGPSVPDLCYDTTP